MRRVLFPLALGFGGVAILISLGVWQVQRLAWKEDLLAGIEARIGDTPIPLGDLGPIDPEAMQYQPVRMSGRTTGDEVQVLSGLKTVGAGYRIVSAFETDGGQRVMLDRGFVPEADRRLDRPATDLTLTGNLIWPDDADSFTPPPDLTAKLWFSRDIASMAEALETDPLLVVLRQADGDLQGVLPQPVTTAGIPNDHFGYAVTWFSLAAVWMTAYLLWRIRRRTI